MEGLIKGLIDVTLGGGGREGDEETRDERSRSSWAEVVSGDQDGDHRDHNSNRWGRQKESQVGRQEWEGPDARISRPPYKEEQQENDEAWQTAGKKPRRRPQKVQMEQWQGYKRPPSEQEYSDEVRISSSLEPSEEELSDFSQACNKLWELDLNRVEPGKDYQIDCAEGKKVYQKDDMAEGCLFYWVSDEVFRKPTYSRFFSLLDNYNPVQGCREDVNSEERQEQAAFIEEISRTAPIKYLYNYLSSKGVISENYQEFKRTMTRLWFDLYARGGASGSSSAFEHVFVGEIKNRGEQEVSGFHNWLQFYLEESKGAVDYQGYILPRRRGEIPDSDTQLLAIQFEWNGVLKSVSTFLVGVSPEFEMALYTLCFFLGGEENHIQLGPYPVNIRCHRFGDKIGSVFPVAEC